MTIAVKKLDGGGDTALNDALNKAAMLGIDIIELIWIPRNRMPYFGIMEVNGFQFPTVSINANVFDDTIPDSNWIDGTLKFYPDDAGRLWGYVYDTKENRMHLAHSLGSGWFKIVDKKIRDEIIELARQNNLVTEPYPEVQNLTKKSTGEKKNDEQLVKKEKEIIELSQRLKFLEEELLKAKGDKAAYINNRMRGRPSSKKTDK